MTREKSVPTEVRLLDGASAALARHGVRSTSVQNVLEAAGVSRRTFYQHFRSLDDVLRALYEQITDKLLDDVRAAAGSTDDPVQRLFAGLDAYLDFELEGGDLLILLQAEAQRPDSLLAEARRKTLDALVGFIADSVEHDTGFRFDPLVFRTLFVGMDGVVIDLQQARAFTRADRDRLASVIKPMFLAVLMSAAHLPGPPELEP
ncbi:MAG: TetR/AcrR family transcriptional regulator [Proteobacteria bacterium]|nr:TetR/AcrR family transcriptional regulator [Pseudomonadota bacterium]